MAQYGSNRRLFGYVNGHGVLLERFLTAGMPPVLGYALTQAAYDQITPVEDTYYVIFDGAQQTPIYEVVHCTQAEYEQLTPWANGLYIIEDSGEITDVYCGTTNASKLYEGDTQVWIGYPSWFPANSDWENIVWFDNHESYNPKYWIQFGIIRSGGVAVLRYTTQISGTYSFEWASDAVSSGSWTRNYASRQYAFYANGVWTRNTGSFIKSTSDTLSGVSKIFLLNYSETGLTPVLTGIPHE